MSRIRGMLLAALICTLSPAFVLAVGETPSSSGSCPAGSVPITAATREQATAAGIPASSTCWNPQDQNTGADVGAAKQFLITRYEPGSASSVGLANPKVDGIEKLDGNFAVNLAKMMKAAPMDLRIISAYRSCAGQLQANPGGYGGDCSRAPHTKGIAVDFKYGKDDCSGTAHNWIKSNASQYGLGLYNQLHNYVAGECNHIELASGKGGSPSTPGTGSSPYGQGAPLGSGQDVASSAQGPCPTGYVYYNNQCYALQNNQPLGAAQQPMQYMPQQSSAGQAGMPTSPSLSQPYDNSPYNTNTNPFNTSAWTSSTTQLRLAEAIINGTTTGTGATIGTSSTFTSDSLHSVATFWDGTPASDTLLNTSATLATNTLTYAQLTTAENTFASADIGTAADYTATSTSRTRVALENLRRWLVYLLEVLGLLRRGAPTQEIQNLPLPQLIQPVPGAQEGGGD